jgi:hypothetical protein
VYHPEWLANPVDAARADDNAQRRDGDNDDDKQDRDPRHQYVAPTKTVHSIFGRKVSLESKRERKLLKRACMSVANADNLITDPRFLAWSHQEISFNHKNRWVIIPKPCRFPLVLDPYINSVQFERVLIDGDSSIDILFRNSLPTLKLSQVDLKPYEA